MAFHLQGIDKNSRRKDRAEICEDIFKSWQTFNIAVSFCIDVQRETSNSAQNRQWKIPE